MINGWGFNVKLYSHPPLNSIPLFSVSTSSLKLELLYVVRYRLQAHLLPA
jgi:hypothetical protein